MSARSSGPWRRTWKRFRRHKLAIFGGAVVFSIVAIAIFQDHIAPYDPLEMEPSLRGEGPSWSHPLGRDELGRDLLSRIIFGTRVALKVGFAAAGISLLIGTILGAVSGYFGGLADTCIMRIVDTLMAFPILLLIMAIVAVIGPNLMNVMVGIGLVAWSKYARVVRAEVLSLRERDFIVSAKVIGASELRIIFRHIVPNVMASIIVLGTLNVAEAILLESSLSFIGLGIQPPDASWGTILSKGRAYILSYPHIATFPGIAITITVLGLNFFGDGLRDALDPKLAGAIKI